jgi:UDP-4-amino-4,6-dideoxy-N-acetyl-beta-L-altrosamine transaminase
MKIPYGKQFIEQDDIDAVVQVLKSDFLTQGPIVDKFEEEFARVTGAKYAVSFCNATAALHVGFKILNKDITKKVLVSPITFAASSNCVLFERGQVEFVDIDPLTFNIDLNLLEKILEKNPEAYQGVIPVDFAGLPVDTERLRKIADKFNLWIMEDACHAIGGGFYNSKKEFIKCGSGTYSDLTVFSFNPVKHVATGEGGMITTNDINKYKSLIRLRSHGIERSEALFVEKAHGGWYHEMQELGYNYKLSDINAALGLSQLKKLLKNIETRNRFAEKYRNYFKATKDSFQEFDNEKFVNAYHLFVIQVENRKKLYEHFKKNNIYTQVHYLPVYKHPYYQSHGFSQVHLAVAENYYSKALSLPMYHSLTQEEFEYILKVVFRVDLVVIDPIH